MTTALAARFMAKVHMSPANGCWEWTGAHNPDGYGWFRRDGRGMELAHRVSYDLFSGKTLEPRLPVMHSCDNPGCVNPAHLTQGNQSINMRDCLKRGRLTHAKLSERDVAEIRRRAPTERPTHLAKEFGVTHPTIIRIRDGDTWRHMP